MAQWGVLGVAAEGEPIELNGLNLWDVQWRIVDHTPITLRHPHFPSQPHEWNVYEIEGAVRSIRFAASELSSGVWGFCVPMPS